MRQAGIMAAAGLIGITKMIERLPEDHKNAKFLANSLLKMGFCIDIKSVQTNMVYFKLPSKKMDPMIFLNHLDKNRIKINSPSDGRFRAVIHYDINKQDIEFIIKVIRQFIMLK